MEDQQYKIDGFTYDAALYFIDGQYLFRYFEEGMRQSKFLSPRSVAVAFQGEAQDTQWIPKGIVRMGEREYGKWWVYWHPREKVNLSFTTRKGIQSIPVLIPSIAIVMKAKAFYVVAFKNKEFDPTADCYWAPFPNLDNRGKVCFGGNTLEDLSPEAIWETFLGSPFTSENVAGHSKSYPNDVRQVYIAMHQAKKTRYPLSDLIKIGSFETYVERILE